MLIFVGYLLIFIYIFLLIFVLGPLIKGKYNLETSRKFIHICLFFVWVLIDIFMKNTVHQFIVPIIFLILNILSYKYNIYKSVERIEKNHYGTIYFALAIFFVMFFVYLFPKYYICSGISIFCLTFGDGFASLIGSNFQSLKIYKDKTLNGFIACLFASFISLVVFNYFYNVNLTLMYIFLISMITSIFELVSNGLDNIFIVFMSMLVSCLLIYFNVAFFSISLFISIIIFLVVFYFRAIDYTGSLISMFMVFCYSFFGGSSALLFLLFEYFTIFIISFYKKVRFKINNKLEKKNYLQILVNGSIGTLFVIFYGIIGDLSLLIISLISISGAFIDSISSDIGVLTKKNTYDIVKFKKIPKGISGGVSFLGTISSMIFAFIISLFMYLKFKFGFNYFIISFSLIFLQTIIDSVLGSLLQVKYYCSKCKKIVEKRVCCGLNSIKISGYNCVDNNLVNFISSVIIVFIAMVVYIN